MPAYNVEEYVRDAICSIQNQSYSNFEFIIINDGSTDKTSEIIESISDTRIIYINNKENQGNYYCRNEACKIAKGKYICVMDADDIAIPYRIETQVMLMESHHNVLALGSDFKLFNGTVCQRPRNYPVLKVFMLHNNMFLHPSLIIRRSILEKVSFYDEKYCYSSDYDLICKIGEQGVVANIPEVLMKYRTHPKQISSKCYSDQCTYADSIRMIYLRNSGINLTNEEERIFTLLMRKEFNKVDLGLASVTFNTIRHQNMKVKYFDTNILDYFINCFSSCLKI